MSAEAQRRLTGSAKRAERIEAEWSTLSRILNFQIKIRRMGDA